MRTLKDVKPGDTVCVAKPSWRRRQSGEGPSIDDSHIEHVEVTEVKRKYLYVDSPYRHKVRFDRETGFSAETRYRAYVDEAAFRAHIELERLRHSVGRRLRHYALDARLRSATREQVMAFDAALTEIGL